MIEIAIIRKEANLLSLVPTRLKKVANTEGGEYASACPFCREGVDRFRVQPYHPDGPRWFCRVCGGGKWHDAIDYVMKRDDCDLPRALETLKQPGLRTKEPRQGILPAKAEADPAEVDHRKWVEAAGQFIAESVVTLWSDAGKPARDYLHGRGLDDTTLHTWMIGYNDVGGFDNPREWGMAPGTVMKLPRGIVIPCRDQTGLHYIKMRPDSGNPKYMYLTGSKLWLYGAQNLPGTVYATILESELDCLLAWQTTFNIGCVSTPIRTNIPPDWQPMFENIEDVIVMFDEDEPGQRAAEQMCKFSHFWKAPHLPEGKDLTEYHQRGGDVFGYLFNAVGVINYG
jgi:DNA primase